MVPSLKEYRWLRTTAAIRKKEEEKSREERNTDVLRGGTVLKVRCDHRLWQRPSPHSKFINRTEK
jgi:transcriptional regulator of NAD metabolism